MNDGALNCAPCVIPTSTSGNNNDENPSPVQEIIVACTGKGRTCKCDPCVASRREKAIFKFMKKTSDNFKVNNICNYLSFILMIAVVTMLLLLFVFFR